VALKVSIADSSVPLIDESTAFTVGPFGYISDVLFAVHDVRPPSGIGVFITPTIYNLPLFVILQGKQEEVMF
jgi:hypothetical protein